MQSKSCLIFEQKTAPDRSFSQPNILKIVLQSILLSSYWRYLESMLGVGKSTPGHLYPASEGLFGGETCKSGAVISSNAWQPTGF
jgi:hypothetical protein